MESWTDWMFADAIGIGSMAVIITTTVIICGIGGMITYKALKGGKSADGGEQR